MASDQPTAPGLEHWHRVKAWAVWTDTGKFGVCFFTPSGDRVTHYFKEMPPGLVGALEQCK